MSTFETPRAGGHPARSVYFPRLPEPASIVELIGLDAPFEGLDELKKQRVTSNLYDALQAKKFPFTDLRVCDQFQILVFIFTCEDDNIALFLETEKAQELFRPLISTSTLSRSQKVELAVRMMVKDGSDVIHSCDFLTHGEMEDAKQKYQKLLQTTFPNVLVPSDIGEIEKFAFKQFSGARSLQASQHHFVLVGLLYAKDPDIEAIQHVAYKYLCEQKSYFSKYGFSRVIREPETPTISSNYSRFRPGRHSISALHPGGFYAIQDFLAGEISGAGIDDEEPGLLIYPISSVSDERLVKRAQDVAAQNMDFPAFLDISNVDTKEIAYDERKGITRIYSSVQLDDEDYEIVPLQPRVNCPSRASIERLYDAEFVDRIYNSLKNPVQIENPKDPVRRVLFQNDEVSAPEPVETDAPNENDKHFLYFIFKCLFGLFIFKIGLLIFEYFQSKFSPE